MVTDALVAVGQRVEAGAMLFRLADSSQLQLDVQLSSDKAAQLQVGDEVGLEAGGVYDQSALALQGLSNA